MAVEVVAALCGAFFILGAVLVNLYCPLRESGKGANVGVVLLIIMGLIFSVLGLLSWNEGGFVTVVGGGLRLVYAFYGFQAIRIRSIQMMRRFSKFGPFFVWVFALFDVVSIFLYVQWFGAIQAKQWHRTTEDTFVATAIIGSAADLIALGWTSLCAREVMKEVERETFWETQIEDEN